MIYFENDTFHLCNQHTSYIFKIMKNGQLGQLYFGKAIAHRESFDHLLVERGVILAACAFEGDLDFSLEVLKQEYPAYGTGDFRNPAYEIASENGSRITEFSYQSHVILQEKPALQGLPHTHSGLVETLQITLFDPVLKASICLQYHLFQDVSAIIRSATFSNQGQQTLALNRAMSLNLDLYDSDYEMLTLDGAWSRERHISCRKLTKGSQSVYSSRGASSSAHNPFLALKRPSTTECTGDAYGFSLLYSGNFLAEAYVDPFDVTRILLGINPFGFSWQLEPGQTFQTPEAAMVYSDQGLNGMSQNFHNLFRNHLMQGPYHNKPRPVLLNNWEATYFDFTEDSILELATKAKELGVELFVLDDGWFGKRDNDATSLGDWYVYEKKLPNGIAGLCEKIQALGMDFGLWFEPEMVNEISDLYQTHPDFVIHTPQRKLSYGRNQYVLDFSRPQVVDYIFDAMCGILDQANISYIKWDMNRNITQGYSIDLPPQRQQEFFHRYILGVYDLYQRLIDRYPHILFESCASGGGRFDPGMLYYAPQCWTSDDTDAIERLHIQYGTSLAYPIVSMGSHVAAIPNHQVARKTPLSTRANVAYFGTFGYELNLNMLRPEELEQVQSQIAFFKQYRQVLQYGDFYRLQQGNYYSWMVVSQDKKTAILGYYKILATPNPGLKKIKLEGLDPVLTYTCNGREYKGDELMYFGMILETEYTGLLQGPSFQGKYTPGTDKGDFSSQLYVFHSQA